MIAKAAAMCIAGHDYAPLPLPIILLPQNLSSTQIAPYLITCGLYDEYTGHQWLKG